MTNLNRRQKWVVVTMDLLLLLELGISIYAGRQSGNDVTMVFLAVYLSSLIVTVAVARWLLRRWGDAPSESTGAPPVSLRPLS